MDLRAKDFHLRLIEHHWNKKSNVALQKAFDKHLNDKFNFCIYEYFTYESKVINHKALTDLETSYIKKFAQRSGAHTFIGARKNVLGPSVFSEKL